MSDVNSSAPRAGWYPDPAGSTQQRWWDGTAWTDTLRDTPAAPPAPITPPVAPPVAPAAPPVPPVTAQPPYTPAYGEMHPGAPAPAPPYGAPGYTEPGYSQPGRAAAPAYVPPASYVAPQQRDPGIRSNTVWIWFIVGLPLISSLLIFTIDPQTFVSSQGLSPNASSEILMASAASAGVQFISFLISALTVLFGFFDYRALKRAGLQRPFHWAWGFFALLVGPIVYVIGRSVVVKKVTGGGLAPLWAFIGVFALQLILGLVWVAQVVTSLMNSYPYPTP